MKIKTIILSFFILLFSTSSFAKKHHDDSTRVKTIKNTVGINISDPLIRILSKTKMDTIASNIVAPTLFFSHATKKHILRVGLQGTNQLTNTQNELFADKKSESINKFRTTLSYYWKKDITSKLSTQFGINFTSVVHINNQVFDSGFDKVNIFSNSYGGGIGPGILFQYQISKRFSIFTEYMILYQYIYTQSGKKFSAIPDQNYTTYKTQQLGFQFEYPIALFLNYHF